MMYKPRSKSVALILRLTLAVLLMTAVNFMVASAQDAALGLNQAIERKFSDSESHSYRVAATAGQFLRVTVEQRGLDAGVRIAAPDGKAVLEMDATGSGENETVAWIADAAGDYRVIISPSTKSARGSYQIKLTALRAATERDRNVITAQTDFLDAAKLAEANKPESNRQALEKYEQATRGWQQSEESELAALALSYAADTLRALREFPAALEHYNRALALNRATNQRRAEGNTLQAIAETYFLSNQKQKAVEPFQQALAIRRELGDRDAEASTLNNLGAVYSDLGDKIQARQLYEQSLPLRREQASKAVTLSNLGRVYRDLGEKRKALKTQQEALAIRRSLKNRAGEAASLTDIGLVYADLGEHQKALESLTQALAIQRSPNTINFIGRSYYLLGVPQEALRYHEQGLALARTAKNQRAELDALNLMALDYWSLDEYPKALNTLEQALPLAREIKARDLEAAVLNNYGRVYASQGDQAQARDYYNQALLALRGAGNRNGEAAALNNLGFVFEALNDPAQAIESHQKAVALSQEVNDRRREAKARYGIARIESSRNRLKPARQQLEKVIEIVQATRSKLASPELRAEFRASVQQYYDLYIDVLMRMGKRAPKSGLSSMALEVSEQARARSLVELLNESGAEINQGVDATLVERERDLQGQLGEKTSEQIALLNGRAKADQVSEVSQQLEQLTRDLRDLQAQIRSASPRYASLTQPQPLATRGIQQLLDANTMLLEFSLGEQRSYLWAVTPSAVRSFTLPKQSEIEAAAKRFYDLLTARNQFVSKESNQQKRARISEADAESRRASVELGRMLFAQVAPLLGTRRLIIVADGSLQYVPFGALVVSASQRSFPLILNHEIVSLPSASTLAVLRAESAQRPKAEKVVAVFADPVFESKDERVKVVSIKAGEKAGEKLDGKAVETGDKSEGNKDQKKVEPSAGAESNDLSRILLYKSAKDSGTTNGEVRIPRLPNTRREAETIISLASARKIGATQAVFDFAANRSAATDNDLSQYRILHFATHGFLNSLNPELSGLVMSLVNEQGKPQNGYLLAPEIYNLKLPATDLVVLSACQTGLGKEVRGEGVIGLTRGFMYAGAPRVVVSLWSVNDRSTADLMKQFYQAMLINGQTPASGLRSAQLELMRSKQWNAPYYWAAFGLQGEWR